MKGLLSREPFFSPAGIPASDSGKHMEQYFKIGIITGAFGVKGEMKVYPTTDDPRRFKKLKSVLLPEKNGFRSLEVESVRFNKDQVLLKVKGIETPEEVAKYRKMELFVDRDHAVPLGKDEYFVADLLGMHVTSDDGNLSGKIMEVLPTGANDVYQIALEDGRELLLPAIKECVLSVDVEAGEMKIHVLDGLLEEA